MKYALFLLVSFFSVAATLQGAVNIVVDFETPDVATSTVVGSSFVSDGFEFTASTATLGIATTDASFYNGSQTLVNTNFGQTITISRQGGGLFSANTIDLDSAGTSPNVILAEGTYENGEKFSQTFFVDGVSGNETFGFDSSTITGAGLNVGFNDLASLDITSATVTGFQIDNFTATVVPEPSSALLFGLSALAFTTFRRRNHCVTV